MVDKIREYQKKHKEGSLEFGIAELLIEISEANPKAAEIIITDLEKKEMNLSAAAKRLEEYAKKNKSGNSYAMTNKKAMELLKEFYGLTELETSKEVVKKAEPDILNLEDLL